MAFIVLLMKRRAAAINQMVCDQIKDVQTVVYKEKHWNFLVFTQVLVDFRVYSIHEMASQFILGLIFILIFLVISLYWRWTRSRFVRLIDAIPGRNYLPVLGNLLDGIHLDPEGLPVKKYIIITNSFSPLFNSFIFDLPIIVF